MFVSLSTSLAATMSSQKVVYAQKQLNIVILLLKVSIIHVYESISSAAISSRCQCDWRAAFLNYVQKATPPPLAHCLSVPKKILFSTVMRCLLCRLHFNAASFEDQRIFSCHDSFLRRGVCARVVPPAAAASTEPMLQVNFVG